VPVCLCEIALQRVEEKQATAQNIVCTVIPVDDPASIDENSGMGAAKNRQSILSRTKVFNVVLNDGLGKPELKADYHN
jgi:hypothetical protein